MRDTNRRNMHEAAKQSSSQEVQRERLTVNEACDLEARSKDRKIQLRELKVVASGEQDIQ